MNANELQALGLTTTISSNNILNAFTPYGDASLVRMANMYANIAQAHHRRRNPGGLRDSDHQCR
ncbi:MAG: hypothetical protein WKG07_44830 [Hymenobacter sp.]